MNWSPAQLLNNEPAHPVALDMLLLRAFGPRAYDWEPETLFLEIERSMRASPPQYNRDALQAVRLLHCSDAFAKDWYLFEKVVAGLNNVPVDFVMGQKPTTGQIMAAIDAIRVIRPVPLSDEVKMYTAAVIREDAVYPVPPILQFCEQWVPETIPNTNGADDEQYFRERKLLMKQQTQQVLLWDPSTLE